MFTGIVEKGIVKAVIHEKNLIILTLDVGTLSKELRLGDSIAVNGVCLTVTAKKASVISLDLMKETIEKTSLKQLVKGSCVNVELALKANSRFGGHFVTGHVDELGVIKKIAKAKNWVSVTVGISDVNRKYIVPKGSVTLDGISLTVGRVAKNSFDVFLIPYTLRRTNLSAKKKGDTLNIETDILAKYLFASKL